MVATIEINSKTAIETKNVWILDKKDDSTYCSTKTQMNDFSYNLYTKMRYA